MEKFEEITEIFKALSDPTRMRIVKLLSENSMLCVNALTFQLKVTQSAVSQHLRILRQAGLVSSVRNGYFIHYSLNKNTLGKLNLSIQEIMDEKK